MPPKLNHTKSRAGCRRCKVRRVKCDETHPVCNNCSRHGVACEYGTASSAASPIHPVAHKKISHDESALDPDQRRLLELQLLHHFTTVVIFTFPASDSKANLAVWTEYGVGMSFEHPFLLNSILALSALHFVCILRGTAKDSTSNSPTFSKPQSIKSPVGTISPIKAHRMYLNLALKQHREAVDAINQNTANALLLSTILLSYQALGFTQDCDSDVSYSPPTHWLRLVKGIAEIARAIEPFVKDAPLTEFMARESGKPDLLDSDAIFNRDNCQPFLSLLNFTLFPEPDFDPEVKKTYEMTLAYIGGIYNDLRDRETDRVVFRRIFAMGLMVPEQFIDLIEQRRPRALAILAYYCSTLRAIDDTWIFRGMAEREVKGLQTILPAEWQWSLQWPQSMLLWEFGLPLPVPS